MRSISEIFNDRSCYKFQDKPVSIEILESIYNLMKMGPTSGNCCPLRIIFVQSEVEKSKLLKCLASGNIEKSKSAPVIAIFAYDLEYYNKMDKLFPHNPNMKKYLSSSQEIIFSTAFRNSTLQAAYFMMIARAHGIDSAAMSGFDEKALNEAFFANSNYRVNFVLNLGYKDGDNPFPRLPRLDFDDACEVI